MNPVSSISTRLAAAIGAIAVALSIQSPQQTSIQAAVHPPTVNQSARTIVVNQTDLNGIPMAPPAATPPPDIVSQAAVVMDLNTGTIIYAKNPLERHYPASITKILTAILALQHGHLSDKLTASPDAVNQPPDNLSLVPGEQESLEQLLYGLLLISANDAAVEIAEHYGGSVSGFAKMMNEEAVKLGAVHSNFVNPNGLPDPHHYTTAYDMALIARAAMGLPEFRKIVDTKFYQWTGAHWQSHLMNINKMLFIYPGAIGIKTGYTSVAHETLAVAAKHGDETLLAILMDTPTNGAIRQDATSLLDYGFANYRTQTLIHQGAKVGHVKLVQGSTLPVAAGANVMVTTSIRQPLHVHSVILAQPILHSVHQGAVVGSLQLRVGQQVISSVPLVAMRSVQVNDGSRNPSNPTDIVLLCILLGFVVMMSVRVLQSVRVNS